MKKKAGYQFEQDRFQLRPIDQVTPNGYNPKEPDTPDFRKVVASVKANGLRGAIIVRDHPHQADCVEIIDGQQRWTAAKELGYKEVWVYNEGDVDEKKAKELTIWYQQQVPFDRVLEAFLVTELVDEFGDEFESPYSPEEINEFSSVAEHDFVTKDGGKPGLGEPVSQYSIIFDNEGQLQTWYEFVRHLKGTRTEETIGARIAAHCQEIVPE